MNSTRRSSRPSPIIRRTEVRLLISIFSKVARPYGAGHADVAHGKITSDHVRLLSRLLSGLEEVNAVLSSSSNAGVQWATPSTWSLAAPERANTWNAIRPQLRAPRRATRRRFRLAAPPVLRNHCSRSGWSTIQNLGSPQKRYCGSRPTLGRTSLRPHPGPMQDDSLAGKRPNAGQEGTQTTCIAPIRSLAFSVAQAADIPLSARLLRWRGAPRRRTPCPTPRWSVYRSAGESEILDRMAKEDDIETGVVDEFMSAYDASRRTSKVSQRKKRDASGVPSGRAAPALG